MSEPGTTQKNPAVAETSTTNLAANLIESGSNPESIIDGSSGAKDDSARPQELGGPAGLEPTRFGDWERKGRCIDF